MKTQASRGFRGAHSPSRSWHPPVRAAHAQEAPATYRRHRAGRTAAADEPVAEATPEIDAVKSSPAPAFAASPRRIVPDRAGRADIDPRPRRRPPRSFGRSPDFQFRVTDSARNQAGGAGNIAYGNSINIRGIVPRDPDAAQQPPREPGTLGANFDPSIIPPSRCNGSNHRRRRFGHLRIGRGFRRCQLILRRNYDGVGWAQYGVGENYHDFTVSGSSACAGHRALRCPAPIAARSTASTATFMV